jgi:phospholipase/lecithinase/hemolysin
MQIAQIIGDPTLIGLDDSVFPCGVPVGVTGGGLPILDFVACSPSVSKVFWDDVHPTSAVHAELARITRNAISANVAPIPLPMPAALLGAGLFMLAAVRRRRPCQAAVLQNSGR